MLHVNRTVPLHESLLFGQAHGTATELILKGNFDTSELSDIQALLMKHCAQTHNDILHMFITTNKFISKFKCWKESTSTSPSGMHLGHYKALVLQNDSDPSTAEGKLIKTQCKALISAQFAMINYTIKQSYSYTRWKNIVNNMIKKEPGNLKVHGLGVIHIYKADFNFVLQARWRTLLQHAEESKSLHPGQYGSLSVKTQSSQRFWKR
jgi:hypothetical protein